MSTEDYILVGKKDTGDDFDWEEMLISTGADLTGAAETIVDVGTGNIPADAPSTGTLRVTLDDGRHRRIAYTSHDSDDEFTIGSSDWQGALSAAAGNGVMISFIDKLCDADPQTITIKYNAARTFWVRARDGKATPIKTYEASASFGTTGGQATITRISDA